MASRTWPGCWMPLNMSRRGPTKPGITLTANQAREGRGAGSSSPEGPARTPATGGGGGSRRQARGRRARWAPILPGPCGSMARRPSAPCWAKRGHRSPARDVSTFSLSDLEKGAPYIGVGPKHARYPERRSWRRVLRRRQGRAPLQFPARGGFLGGLRFSDPGGHPISTDFVGAGGGVRKGKGPQGALGASRTRPAAGHSNFRPACDRADGGNFSPPIPTPSGACEQLARGAGGRHSHPYEPGGHHAPDGKGGHLPDVTVATGDARPGCGVGGGSWSDPARTPGQRRGPAGARAGR
jgi:hypothetical protein